MLIKFGNIPVLKNDQKIQAGENKCVKPICPVWNVVLRNAIDPG